MKVQSVARRIAPPELTTAPPPTIAAAPDWVGSETAELPLKVTRHKTSVPPSLRIAPPRTSPGPTGSRTVALPLESVMSSIESRASAPFRAKIRLESLPLTASLAAPGPSIDRPPMTSSWPEARTIVPASAGANRIVSAPAASLARVTASRSEPAPASSRFVTTNAARRWRSSSRSPAPRARPRTARTPRHRKAIASLRCDRPGIAAGKIAIDRAIAGCRPQSHLPPAKS